MYLNTIKYLSGIPDDVYLLSPTVLESIFKMKQKTSYKSKYSLNLSEVLIALSICAENNPVIEKTIEAFGKEKIFFRGNLCLISYGLLWF